MRGQGEGTRMRRRDITGERIVFYVKKREVQHLLGKRVWMGMGKRVSLYGAWRRVSQNCNKPKGSEAHKFS